MNFTKEQLSELICKYSEKENGLHDLMEIMHESLMVSECREYLHEEGVAGNKCNGYRPGRTYGMDVHWLSVFHVTGMVTFIPVYWPYSVNRKKSVNSLLGPCIPKV
ncbi:hypothetical protein BACPLE_00069 [Phocaeicola plebeius DSM 17135]|uniref:Uncharacterized protein n=1 Tax=Phocaeicola plebeius (strain DSM 17135 / JCM 12973 / CCUG 54634 / M2) TaxID=484018 RepID=B5CTY5_PHOPM|nr:hypothetical protein BACPLE_00069 [Phocaeicola plebeius DSM 17135]